MAVTRVAYEADGWGEGELWFSGSRLVWHELPRPRPQPTRPKRTRPFPDHPHPGGEAARRPAAKRPVREADQWKGSGETGRLPQRPTTYARYETAPNVRQLIHRIRRFFAGDRVDFDDFALDLDGFTPFQLAVMRALRNVRYGEVVTYAELARAAGHANAQRAAGTFCAHNRFPIVVPCHRVVAATGIGSYGSLGVEYKRRLLALEGSAHAL